MRLLLITGLPASGKSTLANELAARYGAPLLSKDLIKEPLLDVLGVGSLEHSRLLSDASFTVLFAIARQFAAAGIDLIIEGNFRPAEHAAALADLADARLAQVLCRINEAARLARLAARQEQRHAGHPDTDPAVLGDRAADAFLDLPGERLTFGGDELARAREIDAIDRWWRQS